MCMHLPLMVACAGLVVTQIRQFVLVQTSKRTVLFSDTCPVILIIIARWT